ncbi:hypothetical protein AAY473_036866 [Plecturocebus cupreus]
MQRLIRYREALLEGLKKGGPERKEESPTQFYERLCEAYRMYTLFDPDSPKNQRMINTALVSQCAEDIRRKLQKQAGFACMNTSQLLEIANKVFVNRETVSQRESRKEGECLARQNVDLIVATIKGAPPREQGKRGSWKASQFVHLRLQGDQCAFCWEIGRWKEKCPRLMGKQGDPEHEASDKSKGALFNLMEGPLD